MGNRLSIAIILLCVGSSIFTLNRFGVFRPLEQYAFEFRMASDSRRATGKTILAAIDQRSIEELATWPWPREIHAKLLDQLLELGAAEVLFDVGFSTPSTQNSDDRLAASLRQAGGKVILPVFQQPNGVGRHSDSTSETFPIDLFREQVWLAAVNIKPSTDGRVWTYPWAQEINGSQFGSAGAVIAGQSGPADDAFLVNYAIDPATIPKYSAIDILNGTVHRNLIEGRSVVIGADAAGLRDNVAVPVQGIVAGALLHILAAETLIADIVPTPLKSEVPFVITAVLAAILALSTLGRKPFIYSGVLGAASLVVEISAISIYKYSLIIVPTVALHATLISFAVSLVMRELNLRRWIAHNFSTDARNTQQLLKQVISASSEAILVVDEQGSILEMNAYAQILFPVSGPSRHVVKYTTVFPKELSLAVDRATQSLRQGHAMPKEVVSLHYHRDKERYIECSIVPSYLHYKGRAIKLEGADVVAIISIQDLTATQTQQKQLNYLIHHDVLTGALNRNGLVRNIEEILQDEVCDVLVVNLRGFAAINLTFGRAIGDCVLKNVVLRLEETSPDATCVARLNGDAFAIAYPSSCVESAQTVADAILSVLEEPFEIGGVNVNIRARIGIARSEVADEACAVIEKAEIALEAARKVGGQHCRYFLKEMVSGQERSRRLERALWKAIGNSELQLMYQPQVDLESYEIIGAEALVRWHHPEMGYVEPSDFISIAETSGFIDKLDQWVLTRACEDAAGWPRSIPVSVNISQHQFESGRIEDSVRRALKRSGLPPNQLRLEVSEKSFAGELPRFSQALASLRQIGVSLSLDDFGGSVLALGTIAGQPFDRVKLHRDFVRRLIEDEHTGAVISAIVTLSSKFGVGLLCEGVETIVQKERLVELGCKQAQGFHFGRPMTLVDFLNFLRAHAGRPGAVEAWDQKHGHDGRVDERLNLPRSQLSIV